MSEGQRCRWILGIRPSGHCEYLHEVVRDDRGQWWRVSTEVMPGGALGEPRAYPSSYRVSVALVAEALGAGPALRMGPVPQEEGGASAEM